MYMNNKIKGRLGFGLMRLPLIDGSDSKSVDEKKLKEMVDTFMGNGFNYFDTAYSYHGGLSEIYFKKLVIDRYPREDYVIVDKMPTWLIKSSEDFPKYFSKQLERTNLEYFDYYLMHCVGEDTHNTIVDCGGYEYLKTLKKEGKIKHIGISLHDNAEYLEKILNEVPEIEMVLMQINYVDWEAENIESKKCYEVAKKYGKEVMVMEPVKGGYLAEFSEDISKHFTDYNSDDSIASWALRFAASLDVDVVVSGMSDINQMNDNLSVFSDFKPLNNEEYEIIADVVDIINESLPIKCTNCNYCIDSCPNNIPIPKYFSLYNNQYQYGFQQLYVEYYNNLATIYGAKSSDCINCGECLTHCPQKINISDELEKCVKCFEDK